MSLKVADMVMSLNMGLQTGAKNGSVHVAGLGSMLLR